MLYLDTETCGYHGPIVLLQYAEDDGEVVLYDVWNSPISETLDLIQWIALHEDGICGFNLAFDWFHICQLYTCLSLLANQVGANAYPIEHISTYADLEPEARDGVCVKPHAPLDLMLLARKGEYQSTMDRGDISIRRVPMSLGSLLCEVLDDKIPINNVYFARSGNPKRRWHVIYRELPDGEPDTDFVDIKLAFAPSSALKALAQDALGLDEVIKFVDIDIPDSYKPDELGYAPFAKAAGHYNWTLVIKHHITHWCYNTIARKYATNDVLYLQQLRHFFSARADGLSVIDSRNHALNMSYDNLITGGDTDSTLACMVGAVRWRGFAVNLDMVQAQIDIYKNIIDSAKWNMSSQPMVLKYLTQVMTDTERSALLTNAGKESTGKIILEDLCKWKVSTICKCGGLDAECSICGGEGLVESDEPHPVAIRAQEIQAYRQSLNRINTLQKLITAGRFHASFSVIGTLSSRMSGADGLNAQGIPHEAPIRSCFPLAWPGMILNGGDFDAFEVGLADAVYGDPDLRADLMSGKKIHGLFGEYLFPHMSYDDIMATKEYAGEKNVYGRSKNGVFALLYGGEAYTLKTRVGISEAVANEAYHKWCDKYKVWGEERKKIFDMFCSMRQPGGLGTKVEWHDPVDYIESMLGFRRYFDLENRIVAALFQLGENPPKEFLQHKHKVMRRDREQTASGAVRSALFGAAFGLQAANMRAAANHVIQSSGADLTKRLQADLWAIQSCGIGNWRVMPMNIHDEVMCPTIPEYSDQTTAIVTAFVDKYRPMVPLLGIDWHTSMKNWSEK